MFHPQFPYRTWPAQIPHHGIPALGSRDCWKNPHSHSVQTKASRPWFWYQLAMTCPQIFILHDTYLGDTGCAVTFPLARPNSSPSGVVRCGAVLCCADRGTGDCGVLRQRPRKNTGWLGRAASCPPVNQSRSVDIIRNPTSEADDS